MRRLSFGLAADIEDLLADLYNRRKLTHISCLFGFFSEKTHRKTFSFLPGGRSLFDLASLTKALVTSPLVLFDLRKKNIPLDSSLETWLGVKANLFSDHLRSLKVSSLLNHTSGLSSWKNLWLYSFHRHHQSRETNTHKFLLDYFNEMPLFSHAPHASPTLYSDLGYLLLGLCLEILYEKSLPHIFYDFCQKELLLEEQPLFFKDKLRDKKSQCVPTSYCKIRRRWLVGEVHDENCGALSGNSGHAGLFGSAEGVFFYLDRLLERFKKEFSTAVFSSDGKEFSDIGWKNFLVEDGRSNIRLMGHLGFTGTSFWVEPKSGFYGVFLTNRVISSRKSSWIQGVRKELLETMWKSLRPTIETSSFNP